MAQQFGTIVDTTELQAFNFLLSAIGEGAVLQAELDATTRPDTALAKETIINVLREVLSQGWRFNTEWGFEIAPNGSSPFTWTFRDATTEQLNIFEPPADLIRFEVTKIPSQQGSSFTDIILRESRVFSPGTLVFYNRELQQDGLLEDNYAFLYINYIRYEDWDRCPEVFRQYVMVKAARKFSASIVGSQSLLKLTDRDEREALRSLTSEQSDRDDLNMIYGNAGAFAFLGMRRGMRFGVFEDRDSMKNTAL